MRLEESRVVAEAAALVSAMVELSEVEAQGERLARAELRALRAQISPHFIYNALAAVAAFIHSRPEEARELLIEFSEFIRYAFARQRPYVTLADELQYVEKYLRLEQARFGERLRVRVQVDPEVLHAVVPVLSLQPLVENAVRHGVESRPGGGMVSIEGIDLGADVELRVSDDGDGIDPERAAAALAGRGPGIGLGNVHGRLQSTFGEGYGLVVENGDGDDRGDDAAKVPGRGSRRMSEGLALLAVDDERPALEDLVRMLRASPFVDRVGATASAAEALVELGEAADPFDALFLDVRMPGLDGLELARVLRRFERPPGSCSSARSTTPPSTRSSCAALDYLVKPVSRQRLDEAIDRVAREARSVARRATRASTPTCCRSTRCAAAARGCSPARRSSTCRPTATMCASRRTRGASCCGPGWRTSRRAGRATASSASTAATSSTCAARSRCGRSSTARRCS